MEPHFNLNSKTILFFSVKTFNLEIEIKQKLEYFGASVLYFDERPSNNIFTKGIIRIKKNLYSLKINEYYNKILSKTKDLRIDYLFVNRAEVIPSFFIEKFSYSHPQCCKIFYTWDSFSNHKHATKLLHLFDKRFTFDPEDSFEYKIGFRPLFFLDNFTSIKNEAQNRYKYDILFLGTAHSDRYIIGNQIQNWCSKHNLTSYFYYYLQSRFIYIYKICFDRSFRKFNYKKISFTSLSSNQIISLYKQSKIILDINHPNQKGLTMRTFEAIGAGKKIITTNTGVKNYPFYNSKNILIIDRLNFKLNIDFFNNQYSDIPEEIYNKYTISGWLYDIFFQNEIICNYSREEITKSYKQSL